MPYSPGANSANFNSCADWAGQDGNVTTVGSNGGPSYYGTFDQSGNVWEWNDLAGATGSSRGLRGGDWYYYAFDLSSSYDGLSSGPSLENVHFGFRLASSLNPLNLSYFVDVTDSGNVNDSTGYGAVSYNYKIAQYPVTNCEYAAFLNAIASTDPYALYNTNMDSDPRAGISRSGTSGSYSYTVKTNMGNKPVVYISWFDAARYCNWLHNGKPSGSQNAGTTEDGAYTLNGAVSGNAVAKNSVAAYWIPTQNEWYKAAYYKGGGTNAGYWIYATQSDSDPTCVTADTNGNGPIISDYVSSNLIHQYNLINSFSDIFGGPSLVGLGGSLSSNGYTFSNNLGLSLTNSLINTSNYTIVIDIVFNDLTGGYQKIIDFKNKTIDTGFYLLGNRLNFYNYGINDSIAITTGQTYRIFLSRSSISNIVQFGILNVTNQSFQDSNNAIVSNNVLYFGVDDIATGGERLSATFKKIFIYDGPICSTLISQTQITPTPTNTSTPTRTVTPTKTVSQTNTPTNTITPTKTPLPTTTPTTTPTVTPTISPTRLCPVCPPNHYDVAIIDNNIICCPSGHILLNDHCCAISPTPTKTNTVTPTKTSTVTPTISVSPTKTMTVTPTNTITSTNTLTPTVSISPTNTVTVTNTATPTVTPTPTRTQTPTTTPTVSSAGSGVAGFIVSGAGSGAGSSSANGIYCPDGTFNNKQKYTNSNGWNLYFAYDGGDDIGGWVVSNNLSNQDYDWAYWYSDPEPSQTSPITGTYFGYSTAYLFYFITVSSTTCSVTATLTPTPTVTQTPTITTLNNTVLLLNFDTIPFTDSSVYSSTITNINNVSTGTAKIGAYSASFNGSNQRLDINIGNEFIFGTGDFTAEFWFFAYSVNTESVLISMADPIDARGFYIGLRPWGNGASLQWLIGDGPVWVFQRYGDMLDTPTNIELNTWYHVAMVRDSGILKLYLNGNLIDTVVNSTSINNTNNKITIGGRGNFNQYFNGLIDSVRVLRVASSVSPVPTPTNTTTSTVTPSHTITSTITPSISETVTPTPTITSTPHISDPLFSDVSLLMHFDDSSGNFIDNSINSHLVTSAGSVSISDIQKKFGNTSAYFSGGRLLIDSSSTFGMGTGDFTIEMFVYPTSQTYVGGLINLGTYDNGLLWRHGSNEDILYLNVVHSNWDALINAPLNTWTHIALVRSGSTVTVYSNGVSVHSRNSNADLGSTKNVIIGTGAHNVGEPFYGFIDELRITKGIARYTTNFIPPSERFSDN